MNLTKPEKSLVLADFCHIFMPLKYCLSNFIFGTLNTKK